MPGRKVAFILIIPSSAEDIISISNPLPSTTDIAIKIPEIKAQVALKILEILEIQVAKIAATKATPEIQAILKIQEIPTTKALPVTKTQIKVIAVVVAQLQKMAITTAEIQVIKAVSLAKVAQI